MKKSTKILLIVFILFLVPSVILGRHIFLSLKTIDGKLFFDFNAYSISALALMTISAILGLILFVKFINSLTVDKAIFFSSLPVFVLYGIAIFLLAQLPTYQNATAQSASKLLNLNKENSYNSILWAILLTLIFMLILFINYFIICKPVGRVEKIVARLGDGKIKQDRIKIGGSKQFHNIEHGLNKINNNYLKKDNSLRQFRLESEKYIPKQFFKFLGKNSIAELELGRQVKKKATAMLVKLVGSNVRGKMTMEENFHFVNSYVNTISPIIRKFNGFIDRYVGEGVLAIFSASNDAVDCVHALSRAVNIKNRQNKSLPKVTLQVAIVSGEVAFGVIGEEKRKIPTIVSNVVSKLEKLDEVARLSGSKCVFTKNVLDQLPLHYKFAYRNIGNISFEDEKQYIFEDLEVYSKDLIKQFIKSRAVFEKGVMFYSNGDYSKAYMCLQDAIKENPNDKCAYVYFNKCKDKLG